MKATTRPVVRSMPLRTAAPLPAFVCDSVREPIPATFRQARRPVLASVIDDEYPVVESPVVEVRLQAVESRREPAFFIVGRNDDRQVVIGGGHADWS